VLPPFVSSSFDLCLRPTCSLATYASRLIVARQLIINFLDKGLSVKIEQREKVIDDILLEKGEALDFWASKNGLDIRIVTNLIDGKLKGTRGVPLENRQKMEAAFGQIFDA
jgi:hypothetical protein